MAVLSSIREKTGLMLIVVLGATIAFIAGDSVVSFLSGSSDQNVVGEINGEDVTIDNYDKLVNLYEGLTQGNREQAESQAWQDLIFLNGWLPELDKAGIAVTRDSEDETETSEEFDYLQGKTLHKGLLQQKGPGQSNEDFAAIISQILDQGPENPSYNYIDKQRQFFYITRMKDKYSSLFSQSAYVTTAEAKRNAQGQGTDAAKATFEYAFIPFSKIADTTVEVSDSDLSAYLSANKSKYSNVQDNRSLKYVALSYASSTEDRNKAFNEALEIKSNFAKAENDQDFVNVNSDNSSQIQLQEFNRLPRQIQDDSANIAEGKIYGPFTIGQALEVYKLSQLREGQGVYKTKISTIFVDTARIADDKVAGAIDSARALLATAGLDSIAASTLQWSNSQDIESTDTVNLPKSALEKIFASKSEGLINELISVPAGVLIVKKDEKVTDAVTKYGVATVRLDIVPSQLTRDSVWQIASDLISESASIESLESAVSTMPALRVESAASLSKTATNIGRFTDPEVKSIVSWAYQNPVGAISGDIYDVSSRETYLVVAIDGASERNTPTVEGLKTTLEKEVREEKKAKQLMELLASKSSNDLSALANEINAENSGYVTFNTVRDATLGMRYIPSFSFGFEPVMLGTAFGLKEGQMSGVLVGESGVMIIKLISKTEGTAKKDYSADKKAAITQAKGSEQGKVNQAFGEMIDVNDERYKRY